jgi:hypothetical protein
VKDPSERTSIKPILTAAAPQLFVADVRASCDFFTGKLGFSVAFSASPGERRILSSRTRTEICCCSLGLPHEGSCGRLPRTQR